MVGFGDTLKRFREERGLSLREFSKLSDVDHAYIYRLETGDKVAPSESVFDALCNSLKLSTRRRQLLNVLLGLDSVPDKLLEVILQDDKHSIDAFKIASSMSFRRTKRVTADDWARYLDDVDKLLKARDE